MRIGAKIAAYSTAALVTCALLCPGFMERFNRLGQRWAFIMILSCCITFLLTPLVRSLAWKWKILDMPDARKVHKGPTPLLGGVGIYAGFIISILAYALLSRALIALLIAGGVILAIGFIDDCRGASASLRLILQAVAVVIVMGNGIHFVFLPQGPLGTMLEWLLTLLWIVGITNALNFLDGLDGLATGSAAIMAFYLGVVAVQSGQHFLGWALAGIVGSCLGFLPYNFRFGDATIFLGDAGSTFLGFILACCAVMGNWGPENIIKAFTPPLLIFGLLIFDLIHITLSRVMSRKVTTFKEWIDFVGKDHLHHRLISLGMTRKEVALFIFLFQICLGTGALLIRQIHTMQAVLLLMQGICIILLFSFLEHLGNGEAHGRYRATDKDCIS